jgi:hypothetical protein
MKCAAAPATAQAQFGEPTISAAIAEIIDNFLFFVNVKVVTKID